MILRSDIGSLVWYQGTLDEPIVPQQMTLISLVGDAAFIVDAQGVIYGVSILSISPNRPPTTLEPIQVPNRRK